MNILHDPDLERLLDTLHARSDAQTAELRARKTATGAPPSATLGDDAHNKAFLSDKLVALDRDKAAFCYQCCRALHARRVVEIGTSFGVSTLYLAAAVRDVLRAEGGDGVVTGVEYEPAKAAAARAHFTEAGLSRYIDLREGDLRETLKRLDGPVDFVLVDIWTAMARPALERVAPHLRPGAIVVCDNTERCRTAYTDYFAFINAPENGFRTMTLPFDGGLEYSVFLPDAPDVSEDVKDTDLNERTGSA